MRVENLGEGRTRGSVRVDKPVLVARVRYGFTSLRAQRLVDRGQESVADAEIDEQTHSSEHECHRKCEGERQPDTDRQPAHEPERRR